MGDAMIKAALAKCSADTALRDINDLLAQGVLHRQLSKLKQLTAAITRPTSPLRIQRRKWNCE